MPYYPFGVPQTGCGLLADDYSISSKCRSNMCLKFLVAARRQREMMVIIANAENVKSAEWQDEDNLDASEMIIPEKNDYLSSLNRLKEKAIRSKFPLNITNDMVALVSNWEDRLRPSKCDKKEDPQVWAISFPHLLTLTQKEKKLNPKAMITYKRPTTIGQKLTNYKNLALKKTRKQANGGSRPCEHCALCGLLWKK